ncbi:MAG TPA: glutamyl-tRNA reductase [Kineosporiaceae bacterium]
MSLLVVGLSYRTAPLRLLERVALTSAQCRRLESVLCRGAHIAEAVALSTCNRLEIYAEVSKFHGGVADIGDRLAEATGIELSELTDHLYVHYEAAAVTHIFGVVCGLDSMAVGEQQILGQVRTAMRAAQECGSVGRFLQAVLQHALRLGKRAHTETALDKAGHSLVEAGLEAASEFVGPLNRAHVLVVGAGAMSGLAVATAARLGAGEISVTNRTHARAERLAAGVGGGVTPFDVLPEALGSADIVISCTGAVGHVIDVELARAAQQVRGRPQAYVDLALPRDVEHRVAHIDGVRVIDLELLGQRLISESVSDDVADVRALVAEELEAFLASQRAEAVAPTVVALRALARSVVESELTRLAGRLGDDVDARVRAEVERTVHRVVEKLLHTPTVRIKQLAGAPGGTSYAEALRELFDLDLGAVDAVSSVNGVAAAAVAVGSTA